MKFIQNKINSIRYGTMPEHELCFWIAIGLFMTLCFVEAVT